MQKLAHPRERPMATQGRRGLISRFWGLLNGSAYIAYILLGLRFIFWGLVLYFVCLGLICWGLVLYCGVLVLYLEVLDL